MRRNEVTGQFERAWFSLILHDFGNLAFQIVRVSQDRADLEKEAESINHLFIQSGHDKTLKAAVYEEEL